MTCDLYIRGYIYIYIYHAICIYVCAPYVYVYTYMYEYSHIHGSISMMLCDQCRKSKLHKTHAMPMTYIRTHVYTHTDR